VATITGDDVLPIQENFGTTKSELKRFRNWLVANKCEQVAFEATGVYWIPIYDALSQTIDTNCSQSSADKDHPKRQIGFKRLKAHCDSVLKWSNQEV